MNQMEIHGSTEEKPLFTAWLEAEQCTFRDGTKVYCWCLDWTCSDCVLDKWALHLRRHYISDNILEHRVMARQTTSDQYLPLRVVPDIPSIRSGDFAEILISDVLQYLYGLAVPRYKQCNRKDKNASEHGSDVIAYQLKNVNSTSTSDKLFVFEVKSNASKTGDAEFIKTVKKATKDSKKDPNRVPMTLQYMIDEATDVNDQATQKNLQRFTDMGGSPYQKIFGSAVATSHVKPIDALSCKAPNDVGLSAFSPLIVVHASRLMDLVNSLYGRMTQ